MKRFLVFVALAICLPSFSHGNESDTTLFKGQLSAWTNYNITGDDLAIGGRYIPQVNYSNRFSQKSLFDVELSANIYLNWYSNADPDGEIKPYRVWARYSTPQLEIRAGLQKINFGSATMLRPLMWFDQMDPRDPLQLTDGVWGLLGRYYFLNNANIWIWGLYGNNDPKGWEFFGTKEKTPEFGGRIQYPIPLGEAALSYHHRTAFYYGFTEMREMIFPENRFGFDAKIDWYVGLWVEASWKKLSEEYELFTNQTLINIGADYTFGIGNGLLVTYEHLLAAQDSVSFKFENPINFSLMSVSYPVGLFDNVSAIFYYSWDMEQVYSFVNWQRTYNRISLHLMAYWNPENIILPQQSLNSNLFGGKGVQFMFVFNH
ncbi:MAG TPA: hypothetical protein PL017_00530 [Tenuifilaceae bacterium]|nr:hypothetical protein [Tenuifilaceae bacterium]HPE17325.1 hypothetical protein [Tenuifilaceae bacterium]HPJ44551.1 hypothetical protein [Tenuifilaceae bacterium]HPQ34858.1 hypothetical protein [Tenuifilaceae bacterium]HRX67633.1 hypothetical protein [Tenuifilaceae bacterium]